MERLNNFLKTSKLYQFKIIVLKFYIKKKVELLIQMNKGIYEKSIFQSMVLKIFPNYLTLYPWHHIRFYVKTIIQLTV
jgi:hypothetical protein